MTLRRRNPKPRRRDDDIPTRRGFGADGESPIVRPLRSADCPQDHCDRELGHDGTHFNVRRDAWFGLGLDGEWQVFVRSG